YNRNIGGDILKERVNRLYELRKSRNLTQLALSFRLNLSLSRISAYENGYNIPCDVLIIFAEFYGVSTDYILRFSDKKSKETEFMLRDPEQKLLDFYRNLSLDGKALIDGMVNGYSPSIK
ncbi:MAG: helix-turn-helix transcriptional regulator, partial [Oscillospiraceae bacterium]|nr:helix-turn-helix transcriptional regulator [Oscillospiraceae bacterium]